MLDPTGRPAYDPERAHAGVSAADNLRFNGEWSGAIKAYGRAIALDPSAPAAYYGRAVVRSNTGDLKGAAHDLRTALILEPSYADARVARAGVRLELGDLEGAFADIRAALKHDPGNWQGHLELAGLLSLTGDREATVAEYRHAADLMDARGLKTLADATRDLVADERPAPTSRPPQTVDVINAEQILVALYVDKPDYWPLLGSAWDGARALAQSKGVLVTADLAPRRAGSQSQTEQVTRTALEALARLADGKVSREDLVLEAITAMARSLDDNHTGFLKPAAFRATITGSSYGLGIFWVAGDSGGAIVREVVPGSPAAAAGIQPGDLILQRDAVPDLSELFAAGESGPVRLTVERSGRQLDVNIAPGEYSMPLLSTRLIGRDVGYIHLAAFPSQIQLMPNGQTFLHNLDTALQDLESQGARRWVLDLRGNPGGSATTGALVAARLGYKGQMVEFDYRQGRVGINFALGRDILKRQPLAVLVDQQSISMAEVLSETLKDGGRARVFGAVSAGKVNGAIVQYVAGGALEVTVARIKSGPDRAEIDGAGVIPDEAVSLDRGDLARGYDGQLEAALRYLSSRRLY